ncbi:L-rhamnose isomerase [candidate division KSB1 bacterium]|nr:L-rhamnose isomerase [candidate division KSB1 bacterium]
MTNQHIENGLDVLKHEFGDQRVKQAIEAIKAFRVEIPSWIFGDFGGGRFAGYMPPGFARSIYEKLDDAAIVHQLTGATDCVAVHVLWDLTEDGQTASMRTASDVHAYAHEKGLRMGSISPTYFLSGSYRNSLAATETDTVDRYIEQTIAAGQIANEFGTKLLTIWLPDGSLYPGQIELGKTHTILKKALHRIHQHIDPAVMMLIEYKVFEPGTYSTIIPDWGTAYLLAKELGNNAGVLVDLGHHFHSTNIEQIVARLISENMYCGFHFNTRYAADDDHSVEPNPEMARIFYELVAGDVVVNSDPQKNWAYMIDQCSGRENRIHAMLHSVDSLQHMLARAMLVDRERLVELQAADEIILANRLFNSALVYADVRSIVARARQELNLPMDPLQAYLDSGHQQKIIRERKV